MGRAVTIVAAAVLAPLATAFVPATAARADDTVPAPRSDVLLVVDGAVTLPDVAGGPAETHFDLDALRALPQIEIVTNTPWSRGEQRFAGPTLADVLDAAGARGTRVSALGLDEYRADIEIDEIRRYPIVVAWLHDGEPMSVRRLGPLRIVYPFDAYPELDTLGGHTRSVWQLVRLTVHE